MNLRLLCETVPLLIVEGKLQQAEIFLHEAYSDATRENNLDALEQLSALFVQLYSSFEPPLLEKAEAFSLERERLKPSAYNKLQTAMVLYYVGKDPKRAKEMLNDAVKLGLQENDFSSVYMALSQLGLALLDLNAVDEAAIVLRELEKMIIEKKSIVIGDETLFLERAQAQNVDRPTVRKIAELLAPECRDSEFSRRLNSLITR